MRANVALKGGNNILVKVAKMVGAHDLALRSPLFDREVIELALTIPPWQKLWGTDEKTVLKRAALRSLPRAVVERPKRGMAVPLRAWLNGALGDLARDTLTPRAVRDRGIFRWEYVQRLLCLERMPTDLVRSRSAEKLWLVLVTELHQRALERLATGWRAA
jgi:asparagine synthase (glutamine-hydrolysing)